MIDFKELNFITGQSRTDICIGLSNILKVYDNAGSNILTIYRDGHDVGIKGWMQSRKCEFRTNDDLNHILDTELFRVDYILIDVYDESTKGMIENLERIIRLKTQLPLIFVVGNNEIRQGKAAIKINKFGTDWIKVKKNATFYQITSESNPHSHHQGIPKLMKKYHVEDMFSGWKTGFEELEKSYIRNEKIDRLFEEDETTNLPIQGDDTTE